MRRSLRITYSSKKTPFRSRPMTDLTLFVVPAGSEVNEKLGVVALHSISTVLSMNLPVKRWTESVTFIGGPLAVHIMLNETEAGSLGPSSNALCRLW